MALTIRILSFVFASYFLALFFWSLDDPKLKLDIVSCVLGSLFLIHALFGKKRVDNVIRKIVNRGVKVVPLEKLNKKEEV